MQVERATTAKQIEDALKVRYQVFVEEQQVPEKVEKDGKDELASHFVLYDEEKPIGAGRLRVTGTVGKVERVCVLSSYRKQGFGKQIIAAMEQYAPHLGVTALVLHAQSHAVPFYKKLGYDITSKPFLEAGIEHVTMQKAVSPSKRNR